MPGAPWGSVCGERGTRRDTPESRERGGELRLPHLGGGVSNGGTTTQAGSPHLPVRCPVGQFSPSQFLLKLPEPGRACDAPAVTGSGGSSPSARRSPRNTSPRSRFPWPVLPAAGEARAVTVPLGLRALPWVRRQKPGWRPQGSGSYSPCLICISRCD